MLKSHSTVFKMVFMIQSLCYILNQIHRPIGFTVCNFYHFIFIGGKRDESLILPVNSSLSATLGQDEVSLTNSTTFLETI